MFIKKWMVWCMWASILFVQIGFGMAIESKLNEVIKTQEQTIEVFSILLRKARQDVCGCS